MVDEKRNYRVTQLCCISGMCLECRAVATGGKRKRIVHADNVTKAYAEQCLTGWAAWEPKAERVPGR